MAYAQPFFAPGLPQQGAPVFDPWQIPIFTGPTDPGGIGGLIGGFVGGLVGGGGPPSVPIPGLPLGPGTVTQMPSPIQMTGHCLLRKRRRINWCNPRALNRANRRLHAFNKHARKYIKITRKVKTPKRRKR